MSRTRTLLRSFAGGEISPLLFGRIDLRPYQTGLALCHNFVVMPQGPVRFRPGSRFLTYGAANDARLIPFVYSDDQAYVVELTGNGKIRVHNLTGTLLADSADVPVVSITNSNPATIVFGQGAFADGDDVYLDVVGMPEISDRWYRLDFQSSDGTNDTFVLATVARPSGVDSTGYGTFISGDAMVPLELAHPYAASDLRALRYAQNADVLTIVSRDYEVHTLRRTGPNVWVFSAETFGPSLAAPTTKPAVAQSGPGGGQTKSEFYTYTKVSIDGAEGESFPAPSSDAISVDLTVHGNVVTITPVEGTAPAGYRWNYYKALNGLWGYIGQSEGAFEDRNIVPALAVAPPEYGDTAFQASGDYPGTVSYFQQRKVFAGTINRPHSVWMTRNGTETDMTYTVPSRDDNALGFTVASRELQTIQHLVPLRQLLVLTASGVWKITPQNNDVLTPSSISADLVAYVGASDVQPVTIDASVIYAFSRGGRVGEVKYADSAADFVVSDVCLLAPHLFDGYAVVDMAMMETPARLLWVLRSDGILLSLTYQPEQEVLAWHQHDLGGEVRSICVLPNVTTESLSEDVLFAYVRRKNGPVTYDAIEILHGFGDYPDEHRTSYWAPPGDLALEHAVHVDSALVYEGAPADRLIGLHHLEGRQVSIVSDEAVHPPLTVVNGEIVLEADASRVVVGLPYEGRLTTLPLVLEGSAAEGQGALRSVSRAHLRLLQTSGVFVGPDFDIMDELKARSTEDFGEPPKWKTGYQYEFAVSPTWGFEGHICVKQTDPVPMVLLSMTLDVEIGG